jgi:hypothetical protein
MRRLKTDIHYIGRISISWNSLFSRTDIYFMLKAASGRKPDAAVGHNPFGVEVNPL